MPVEYKPAPQSVHAESPVLVPKVPAAQLRQTVELLLPLLNVPTGHVMHAVALDELPYVPAAQTAQLGVDTQTPPTFVKPALQVTGHDVGVVPPAPEYTPLAPLVHGDSCWQPALQFQ